jgi:anti-sigma factor RsiW
MIGRHLSRELAAHIDGELASSAARRVERHLQECPRCRAEREQVRSGMSALDHLPAAQAPDALWSFIEAAIPRHRPHDALPLRAWRLALATLSVAVVAGALYWRLPHLPETRWAIEQIHGAPTVGAKAVRGAARIGPGEWLETDSSSSATVMVGAIGSLEVAPNTRLRIVTERPGEHRLALARGEIHAKISAPPRLFFVDTASGTAVDLGCEYILHSGEDGSGLLQVTRGWVSFQWKGVESLVPAGASCRTLPLGGPGIPYFDDAPENLKRALESFAAKRSALDVILAEARVRDTLTLWHLLWRVGLADRERIYDRIAALTPIPAGVSRQKALSLDADTMTRWKDELAWTW